MKEIIKQRTQKLTIDCGALCRKFPTDRTYDAYCRQLIRCSASVGANYRAACRAKSDADFVNKLKIVEEEADESMFWLEIFLQVSDKEHEEIKRLHAEANETLAITVASIKTVRARIQRNKNNKNNPN